MSEIWKQKKNKNMSLKKLSIETGLTTMVISRIINQECTPNIENIRKVCEVLDINFISELISMGYLDSFVSFKKELLDRKFNDDVRLEVSHIRKMQGMSRQRLADKIGVNLNSIKAYESRKADRLNLENLYNMSKALNIPCLYLLIREEILSVQEIEDFLRKEKAS